MPFDIEIIVWIKCSSIHWSYSLFHIQSGETQPTTHPAFKFQNYEECDDNNIRKYNFNGITCLSILSNVKMVRSFMNSERTSELKRGVSLPNNPNIVDFFLNFPTTTTIRGHWIHLDFCQFFHSVLSQLPGNKHWNENE